MKSGRHPPGRREFIENADRFFVGCGKEIDGHFGQIGFEVLIRFHTAAHARAHYNGLRCSVDQVPQIIQRKPVTPFAPPRLDYFAVGKDYEVIAVALSVDENRTERAFVDSHGSHDLFFSSAARLTVPRRAFEMPPKPA